MLSLGKGFYEFIFSCVEDIRRVWSSGSLNLNSGTLKFFVWSKDFNPFFQHSTSTQVWVGLFGLSQEYRRPIVLFDISSRVGTLICIDVVSLKSRVDQTFGQFVRVLVNMDFSRSP